jgi:hypothetical protein
MKKTLRVIDPFFTAEVGDTFVLDEDSKMYTSNHSEEFHRAGDENNLDSTFNSTFSLSSDYAKELIEQGYLEEVSENEKTRGFVNVFDEINNLICKYSHDLDNLDEDLKEAPQCVKVEKTTVLTNILSVLNYLKDLKK